jgi:hypothetical protein
MSVEWVPFSESKRNFRLTVCSVRCRNESTLTVYCTHCGAEIVRDSSLCRKCGCAVVKDDGGIFSRRVSSRVSTGSKQHTRTWLFCIVCVIVLILWRASNSRRTETPSRQIPPSQTQSQPEPAQLSAQPESVPALSVPVVTRKLYIDSPDMEEIIEANLRLKAADYGFQVVPSRSDADVVLEGSAGVFKQQGLFGSCMPFYAFDVVRQGGTKRRKKTVFKLQLGVPNDQPCIRFAVAQQILSDLRDGLNALDTKSVRELEQAYKKCLALRDMAHATTRRDSCDLLKKESPQALIELMR